MAITNYSDLSQALPAWLDVGTDSLTATVSQLIQNAEKRIFREVRVPEMEVALSATISNGVISVPSDFVEIKFAYIDTNPVRYVQIVSPSYIYERYPTRGSSGVPSVMARDGSNFIFGPYPDSDYDVKGAYYARLSEIGGSASALVAAHPDLYLYACLVESEPLFGRDQRMALWEAKYRQIRDLVNGEGQRANFSGNMSIRPA